MTFAGLSAAMSTDAELHVNPAELPDDSTFLKPLIVQRFETLQKFQRRAEQLEHHLDLLLRRVFGNRPARPHQPVPQPMANLAWLRRFTLGLLKQNFDAKLNLAMKRRLVPHVSRGSPRQVNELACEEK